MRGFVEKVAALLASALLAFALVPCASLEALGEPADESVSLGADAVDSQAVEVEAVEEEEGALGDALFDDEGIQADGLEAEAEGEARARAGCQDPQTRSTQDIRAFLQSHKHDATASVSYSAKPIA